MRLSFTQESDFRQQRDFGQKISATFEFISAHWRGLGRCLLLIVLPAALLQGIVSGLVQQQMLESGAYTSPGQRATMGSGMLEQLAMLGNVGQSPYYWLSILMGITFIILLVLTVYGYILWCMRPTPSNEPVTVGAVWEVVKAHFFGSFLSYFGLLFFLIIAFALLFIPGIYLSVVLSLFYVVKVIEKTGFGETFSRCRRLIQGKWWSTLGLLVVISLLVTVIGLVIGGTIGGVVGGLAAGFGLVSSGSSAAGLVAIIATTIASLFNILIYPPILIALAFQYFNLVELHDGVGLRNMVDQLGRAPSAVPNAAYRPDEEGEY